MIEKKLDQITADDLEALVTNQTREIRKIEFKLELPGNSDDAKKEFLADVTSFANAGGGDLIFGVSDKDGIAVEAKGLKDFNEDQARLRLESIIRDGINPRVPGIQIHVVNDVKKDPFLLMRIPRSWIGPHMVTFKNTSRFFTRSSNGKYQMDVSELRSAFEGTSELPVRVARWRDERLGRIMANEGPIFLNASTCLILHLAPLESFGNEWRLEASEIRNLQPSPFQPLFSHGNDQRINIDGYLMLTRDHSNGSPASDYTQIFRSGRVEAVTTNLLSNRDGKNLILSVRYEHEVVNVCKNYLNGLKSLGVQTPIVFLLSLCGVRGACMDIDRNRERSLPLHPIDRDVLVLPDVLIESYDCDLPKVLRPAFDSVWNACGAPRSLNFDDDGNWKPQP